jgi:hypothetical protein
MTFTLPAAAVMLKRVTRARSPLIGFQEEWHALHMA